MDAAIGLTGLYLIEYSRLSDTGRYERIDGHLCALLVWFQSDRNLVQKKNVLQNSSHPVRKLKAEELAPLIQELVNLSYIRDAGKVWGMRSI